MRAVINKVGLGIILAALLALVGASSSHAASAFDNAITVADSLVLLNRTPEPDVSEDISVSYMQIILDKCGQTVYDSFVDTLDHENGRWSIATYDNGVSVRVDIGWSQDPAHEIVFVSPDPSHTVQHISEGAAFIEIDSNGDIDCNGWAIGEGNVWIVLGQDSGDYTVLLSTYPVTYPSGYEGELIPETYTPPSPPQDDVPNWKANVVNFDGEFWDANFFNFDSYPFLCEEDTAPIIYWELFIKEGETDILIDSGVNSATALFAYTFEEGDYTLVGWYDCGSEDPLQFNEVGFYNFTINEHGSIDQSHFSDCIKSEFPWVDINACISNVYTLINLLSFGAIKLPEFDSPNGCHTLGTIGDWLMLSNNDRYICPQFSSEVRNITTPFVTFLAGLIVLAAITIKSKREVV